jgi:oligopeptide transport system permease protein
MRLIDLLQSLPLVFVVIFLITIAASRRAFLEEHGIEQLTFFFAAIGLVSWLSTARVVRAEVRAQKARGFVEAALVLGASDARILLRHLLPNVLSVAIVCLTLTIPSLVLYEAFLSYLGLGVQPPAVSWGLLAVDSTEAISPLGTPWWLVCFPTLTIGTSLFALNLLGDALRDALDPRLRGLLR